jgi:tRNA modification GTPase
VFSPADTIVALATAPAPAGIGVVRISGPRARDVAHAILTAPHDLEPRRATLTHVIGTASHRLESPIPNPQVRRAPIDEVVATLFPAPHSYTAEDVVEISAHGSLALLREIVRAAIAAGARLAEPGEFTLRAFLNGRLDLVQAEAVADLVDAVTPLQARVAFDQLDGTLTRAIGVLDEQLFDLAARLEASIDFPEEGYHFVAPGEASDTLVRVRDGIDALLATSAAGRLIREGGHIGILGKPNVGKSSLFNELVGTDRAIVAAGPGTTRDMLRETIDLDGLRLGLVDTAGIRVSEDEVEQEGVVRARKAAAAADLVILVLDRSRPFEDIDIALIRETAAAPRIVVVNKIDLPAAWTPGDLAAGASDPVRSRIPNPQSPTPNPKTGIVHLSLKTREGLDELRAAMRAALDVAEPLRDTVMVTNVRHETLLRQARESLARAIENIGQVAESASEELVLADIADARHAFEDVTGKRTSEDVLRRVFERFCIGK